MTEKKEKKKPIRLQPVRKANARIMAHRALMLIFDKHKNLEEAWQETAAIHHLDSRDKGFCRLLVLTVLRQCGFLDSRIGHYAPRMAKLPLAVLLALRLGAAQILFLESAAHAAVSTSVDLVGANNKPMRGLVNAILRKMITQEEKIVDATLAWQKNIPVWLLENWRKNYGAEQAEAIARACLTEPVLDLTVKENPAHWAEKLGATLLQNNTLRLALQDDITKLSGYLEGAWWVQDVAASLPAPLAGMIKGKIIYDLCAAPGGKTMQLASMGGRVTAVDHAPDRLKRLADNLRRTRLQATLVESDVLAFTPDEKADLVLLDAPCSATGTLRRYPDLILHKTYADVTRLAALQARMLSHASTLVKKGGMLIYAVCSLCDEEGHTVINAFLRENPSWQRQPITPKETLNMQECVTKDGDLRTLPHMMKGGMDGFFAARLISN